MLAMLALLILIHTNSQDTLRLSFVHHMASINWPLAGDFQGLDEIHDIRMTSLRSGWLPDVSAHFSAQYQSQVTRIPTSIPGAMAPSQPHDRYAAILEITQQIWDGGATSKRGQSLQFGHEMDVNRLEIERYSLIDRVNEVYFNWMVLDLRLQSAEILISNLEESLKQLESRRRSGAALTATLDLLRLEQLKIIQDRIELLRLKESAITTLSILTGLNLSGDETLEADSFEVPLKRPELTYFSSNQSLNRSKLAELDTRWMPKISAIGQFGIARPGMNIFNDDFRPYFIVGLQGRWNIWDKGVTSNEKKILDSGIDGLERQKDSFLQAQFIRDTSIRSKIQSLLDQLLIDDEIISLHESIMQTIDSKLQNGSITATEYLIELNTTHQARLQRNIRQVEILKYKAMLQSINYVTE